jgi:hypothetical protein
MNPAAFLGSAGDCSQNALGMAGNVIETHEHAGEFNVMLTYAWGPSASTSIGKVTGRNEQG